MFRKASVSLLLLFSLVIAPACGGDSGTSSKPGQKMVSRYRASVRKEAGDDKSKWVATLAQGEQVELIDVKEVPDKKDPNKKIEYAHVRIAGGSEGYILNQYLANGALVISSDEIKLYQRPTVSSGIARTSGNLKTGVIAFVDGDETVEPEWLEVSGGSGRSFFRGWIKKDQSGYVRDPEVLIAAVRLSDLKNKLSKAKDDEKDKLLEDLKELTEAGFPVGDMAQKLLDKQLSNQDLGEVAPEEETAPVEEGTDGGSQEAAPASTTEGTTTEQ